MKTKATYLLSKLTKIYQHIYERVSSSLLLNVKWITLCFFTLFLFSLHSCRQSEKKSTIFTTIASPQDSIKDSQANTYPIIQIGTQTWMAENLKLTEFECSDSIMVQFTNGLERGQTVQFYDNQARYAYYNNNSKLDFGTLYSYQTIMNCNICPTGFRIPTKTDWEQLVNYLGGKGVAGSRLLQDGDSGFNAKMGGRIDAYGSVLGGRLSFWWSQDTLKGSGGELVYIFEADREGVLKLIGQDKRTGNYVRCVKAMR
ncbi:MAG: FISUMP domain-containing protein [Bacteroidota bacterium]